MTPVARCQAPDRNTPSGRCNKPLVDNQGKRKPAGTKCCDANCRARRLDEQKRLKRERAEQAAATRALPEHLQTVVDAVRGDVKDATHEVLKDELRPIIRDALTEDVLAGLGELVRLIPDAITALGEDIRSDSGLPGQAELRQRAYTLLLKYTAGNATIAPASAEQAATPMQVIFEMPRPGDQRVDAPQPPDVVELRDCVECESTKPTDEFVGSSARCLGCQAVLEKMIVDRGL